MQARNREAFSTVKIEGAILPPDILQRIIDSDSTLGGLNPEDYHLDKGERLNEIINRSWNRLVGAWASFKTGLEKLTSDDVGTTLTRERWLMVLFKELGYGRLLPAKGVEIEGKRYPLSHIWDYVPIHLVGCRVDIDRHMAGVAGAARMSPHSLVQELLNRKKEYLWGIVSNGMSLRILRDNVSLTRLSFVEFDLESMMEGEVYSDFVLLWLLCHESRVEAGRPENCWLEKWSQAAKEQGTRALDQLRGGVEQAITALGRGFISHPANYQLKEKLQKGILSELDYYRQILRFVYRLIFLFVAEDRDVLLNPNDTIESRQRYINYYSTNRLRHLAEKKKGTNHTDLFCGLRLVMQKLDNGCHELALPALGSFLWSEDAVSDIINCEITNQDMLEAIRSLAFTTNNNVRRYIDYKNLGSEELGSIYESLLELHPIINISSGTFELSTAGGNERKTTGSYYTPSSLISCLLDSALDPVLDEACKKKNSEEAILNLKVCDPACGSGHFLIATAHRIAKRLASIRSGYEEPSPDMQRAALRDVIGHCIYGVDINEMAVELCKVSLWMEALEPGKPLNFLDHHIQCGNSLLGATPTLIKSGIPDEAFIPIEGDDKKICSEYKKRNRQEREGQLSWSDINTNLCDSIVNIASDLHNLNNSDDSSIEGIKNKQEKYSQIINSSNYIYEKFIADAWCAAFALKKTNELSNTITDGIFRVLEQNPYSAPEWLNREVRELSRKYQFFHWHLAFPDVIKVPQVGVKPENVHMGWSYGFDAIVGNPPWEKVKVQEREWFSINRRPDIANAPNASVRKEMIDNLKVEDNSLYESFIEECRHAEGESAFINRSGLYLYGAKGDTNTYPLFVEIGCNLINNTGRIGLIVKTGILADYGMKDFFNYLIANNLLISAYDFSNRNLIFPAVVANERFTLLTLCGEENRSHVSKISILNEDVADLSKDGNVWSINKEEIELINPNTKTCPLCQTVKDIQVVKEIYKKYPILIKESEGKENNPWGCSYQTMFHMSNDSYLFLDSETLQSQSKEGPRPQWTTKKEIYLSLLEGKLFDIYNHRHGTFDGIPRNKRFGIKAEPNHPNENLLQDPFYSSIPRYWVKEEEVNKKYQKMLGYIPSAVLVFRDVCRTHTDLRTVRASICPPYGAGNKAPLLVFPGISKEEHSKRSLILCANMSAIIFDYVARQKFSGGSLNKYILIQLPFLKNEDFATPWHTKIKLFDWICSRAIELVYTTWDLKNFARECGFDYSPFCWSSERRFMIQCELDAAFFHLYNIKRDDVGYIMSRFPILQRREEENYGTYRTKELVTQIYEKMEKAIKHEKMYESIVVPKPGDIECTHKMKKGL